MGGTRITSNILLGLLSSTFLFAACTAPQIAERATQTVAVSTAALATGQPVTLIAALPTAVVTSTQPARPTHTSAPSPTGFSTPDRQTVSAQATKKAVGELCDRYETYAVSPNGLWTAVTCYSTGKQPPITFVRVANQDRSQIWDVEYEPGASQAYGNIRPVHWPRNGDYLYLAEMPEVDGCCYYFWEAEQLVRLNLLDGQVSHVLRANEAHVHTFYAFEFSPSDRRLAYIQDGASPLAVHILDLQTGLEERIALQGEFEQAGHFLWSMDEANLAFAYATQKDRDEKPIFGVGLLELQNNRQRVYSTPAEGIYEPKEWRTGNLVDFKARGEAKSLWQLNTDSGEWTQLTSP